MKTTAACSARLRAVISEACIDEKKDAETEHMTDIMKERERENMSRQICRQREARGKREREREREGGGGGCDMAASTERN